MTAIIIRSLLSLRPVFTAKTAFDPWTIADSEGWRSLGQHSFRWTVRWTEGKQSLCRDRPMWAALIGRAGSGGGLGRHCSRLVVEHRRGVNRKRACQIHAIAACAALTDSDRRSRKRPAPAAIAPLGLGPVHHVILQHPPRRGFKVSPKYGGLEREHQKVSLRELFNLLLKEKHAFTGATAAIVLASAASMVMPTIFGNVVDLLSEYATTALPAASSSGAESELLLDKLYENALAMAAVSVAGTGAMFASTAILEIVGQRVGLDLRKKLFSNILEQDMAFFDKNQTGELANRLSTDVHEVAEHLVENVSQLLYATVMGLGSAVMLVVISPSLSLITLSVVPAMALGATQYSKVVKRLSQELLNALASSTQVAAERMSAIRIVRLYAAEEREKARYGRIIDDSMSLAKRLALSEGAYVSAVYFISNFALVGVLFMGAGMVMDGSFSVGALASYCLYANHLSESMKDATDGVAGMIRAQGAAGRLYGLLHLKPELAGGSLRPPMESIRGLIRFQDVTFAYPTRPTTTIFNGLNLTIQPGDNVGITGPSGCGKSSVAQLLTRLYAPLKGRIFLDDVDIADIDPAWLRVVVGTITQEPLLMSGTVRDNIAYGKPDATMEEIEAAARLANADAFVQNLPQGYDTEVGERALVLSGGQKQRLSIARALLLKHRILILDEATSSLDAKNEAEILNKLIEHCAAATVITIGHSARQLKGSTRIIKLSKNGEIVQDEKLTEQSNI